MNNDKQLLLSSSSISSTATIQASRVKRMQAITFVITFSCYAAAHSTRTAWSVSKTNLKTQDSQINNNNLGYVDFTFLFCYAIALKAGGGLGDRFDLRYFLAFGMIPASLFLLSIAVLGLLQDSISIYAIGALMALNGIFQSTGWPGLVATMGNWFNKGNRGLLMGIWSGNCNVGNIIGYLFGQIAINSMQWGWQYCLMFSAIFLFIMGLIVIFFLKPYPKELGIQILEDSPSNPEAITKGKHTLKSEDDLQKSETKQQDEGEEEIDQDDDREEQQAVARLQKNINYFTAWCVPGVPLYAIAYACLKSANYGLLFWLPSYISDSGMDSYSSVIPMMNDIGNFFGGVITGYLSDKNGKRSLFLFPQLIVATFFMAIVKFVLPESEPLYYFFVIFAIGFFLGGPYNILSAAIAIDLAKQPALKGQKSALSTISSLIEGIGSLCAAFTQLLIPRIGQDSVFLLFMILISVSVLFLSPMVIRDLRDLKKQKI